MREEAKQAAVILRKYGSIISDEELSQVLENVDDLGELAEAIYGFGPPFNSREAQVLSQIAGNMDDNTDFERDGDIWNDDVLAKYAEFVHNYEYTYNNEALKVNPNTDTNEVHIGPMAQDLEKVNPAVVKEDPNSGYKTVDTGRLALMNAGAIADLARKIVRLENE